MTDLIVIGAGVAGMTASLYALRNGMQVSLIEKNNIGGQIAESPRVENFPTIESVSGAELADRLFDQITKLGVNFVFGEVEKITKNGDIFEIQTEYETLHSKSVIIASGVEHRKLNLENEESLIGHGLSYCALCDGAFYSGEEVALIGDGNTALQYALLLASQCKGVQIVTMFDKFFGDQKLIDAVKSKENIKIIHNAKLVGLNGGKELESLVFERQDKTKFTLKTKALFIAIGQVPNNSIYANLVDFSKDGYILADENMATKTPGLFVAGDCRLKKVRQLTTACSDGAIAATSASTYLQSLI